jgi:DNA polymerase-3 subunit epsilon
MRPLNKTHFAVVDVETTGFAATRTDRIIEIAILRVSADGSILDEFVSLVNPGRDLGPTGIHGITGRDVLDAPRFCDVVGDVVSRMEEAVVVGHNVRFDSSFVEAECSRAGHMLPEFPVLCTLGLAGELDIPISNRQLVSCCAHFGIRIDGVHSAHSDAVATAQLLAACLKLAAEAGLRTIEDLGCHQLFPPTWPKLPKSGRCLRRGDAQILRASDPNYLSRLVTRLMGIARPSSQDGTSKDIVRYLAMLDRVLEDRLVTESEAEELSAVAREWGLSGEQVCVAHRVFLGELARAALADGVVTESERRDLLEVTRLLGFDNPTLEAVLNEARSSAPNDDGCAGARTRNDLEGKSVCFTGTLMCTLDGQAITRDAAQELATKAGLKVAASVTKALDILVVADPNSLSSKAQKARKYGTRIIAEAVFWRSIGVNVD